MAEKPCKPFSVDIAFLTTDDKHQIEFGLSKDCKDDKPVWTIDFVLKDKKDNDFVKRVEVHVKVGAAKKENTETLAKTMDETKELPETKSELLLGPIKNRALQLPPGTSKDKKLENLISKMVV